MALVGVALLAISACSRPPATPTPPAPSSASAAPSGPSNSTPEPTTASATPGPLITPSTTANPTSLMLSCGGEERFPAAALDGVGHAETENDGPAAVLRQIIAEQPDAIPDRGWHRVAAGPDHVVFVAPGRGDEAWVIVAAFLGSAGWTVDLSGTCQAQPVLPDGIGPADFWLDPGAAPPDPEATALHAFIVERSCASAKPPGGRVLPPVVQFDERTVTVTVSIRQRPGGQDCPGNPIVPITIRLSQPLGDRAILDGSVFPPRDASVPPG